MINGLDLKNKIKKEQDNLMIELNNYKKVVIEQIQSINNLKIT